ncbi:MAG: MFS transporter [Actinomycetota bacterium]
MLRLLFISLAAAIVLGLLAGGRFSGLADTRFRWGWVGMVGVVLQFLPISGALGNVALTASFICLFVVCGVNRRLPGFVLILVGLWTNFVVITVNQGMPITPEAITASGQEDTLAELRELDSPKHHLQGPDDELMFLGDTIGIGPPIEQAVSIGDLAALVGVAWFVIGAMRRRPERGEQAETDGLEIAEETPATGRTRMWRLLHHRDFRLLLAAQTLTMFGDVALVLVLGIWVKDLTGSNGAAGAVFLVYSVPAVITPLAGPLIDRVPRRRIMIVNDFVTMGIALTLLLVHGKGDAWIIYVVAFLYGAVQIVFFAARSGLLVSMLPADQLPEANGLLESLRHGLRIVGPLVGAGLFALWGGGAVAILDASVFLVSAAILSLIRSPDLDRPLSGGWMRGELTAGIRHIVRTIDLRRVVFYTAAVLMVLGIIEVAVFALIEDGLGRDPEFLGVLSTLQGVGAIAGGLFAAAAMTKLGEVRMAAAALVGFGAAVALDATAELGIVLAGSVLSGVFVAFYFVAYQTLLQRRTSVELQGRVFTASEAITTLPYSLSIGLGALIIDVVDFRYLYIATAIACVIGGGLLYRAGAGDEPAPRTPAPTALEPVLADPILVEPGPPPGSPHDL